MIKQLFNIVDPDKIALKIKVIKEFKFVPLQSVRLVPISLPVKNNLGGFNFFKPCKNSSNFIFYSNIIL